MIKITQEQHNVLMKIGESTKLSVARVAISFNIIKEQIWFDAIELTNEEILILLGLFEQIPMIDLDGDMVSSVTDHINNTSMIIYHCVTVAAYSEGAEENERN